ncbi:hypothetical protein [Herbiconiux liangxiaofengii]|uniref:hypothetical protein n=1 Tax=Herbiconiux liangxiaofengii TaxID=3342795 RepID=UPI0035B787F0
MTTPGPRSRSTSLALVRRVLAGVVAAAAGVVFVFSAWMALSSRFAPAATDLHGYGLVFGTVLALVAAFVVAIVLPVVFPAGRRATAGTVSMAAFGLVFIGLIAALVTA